jgi:dolichol-phosphate mannosyltransferase
MKTIEFVIPCFNESGNIELVWNSIHENISQFKELYNFEFLFINDGSTDGTWSEIIKLSTKNKNIMGLNLSRNFGKELAITAGLSHSRGNAIILIDSDLQHPPKYIPEFIQKWENGADMVIGIRQDSDEITWFKKITSKFFNIIMKIISDNEYLPKNTDFRLIDQKIVKEFLKFSEKNRISRSLLDWLGFKRDYIYFQADPRISGLPSYSYSKLIILAISSFVGHSLFPLRLTGYMGFFLTIMFGGLGLFIILNQFVAKSPFSTFIFSGTGMLGVLMLFCIGIILMALGLIALYIGNIHREVLNRHLFVISEKIGRQ